MIKSIAWIVGICAAITVYIGFDNVLKFADIPTYIDFGETITVTRGSGKMSYEEDIDGQSTTAGIAIVILSIMIGSRMGMAIFYKNISGGLDHNGRIEFNAWLYGIMLVLIGSSFMLTIWRAFPDEWYVGATFNIVELILIYCVFIVMRKWRDSRLISLNGNIKRVITSHL